MYTYMGHSTGLVYFDIKKYARKTSQFINLLLPYCKYIMKVYKYNKERA